MSGFEFPNIYNPNWIAKTLPNEVSIKSHCTSVAEESLQLFDSPGVKRFVTDNITEDFETVKEAIAYTGYLHDAGKAHPDWQIWAREPQDNKKLNHSFRGSLFALEYLRNNTDFDEMFIAGISIAILHHHTNISTRNMDIEKENVETYKFNKFSNQFQSYDVDIDITIDGTFDTLRGIQNSLRPESKSEYREVRLLSSLFRTFLIQADHITSAKEKGETKPRPQKLSPQDFTFFDSRRPFQKQVDRHKQKNHLVGLAGCGEGKTHAALQWGEQQIEQGDADGLVFALPTQTTTNNMYLNLTQSQNSISDSHLPKDKCELHHSANDIFYSTQFTENGNDDEHIEHSTETFLSERERKIYSAGMTVSTVDHILNTLINKQELSTLARGNLFNKAVIFDELHAYDDETLSNIIAAIGILHKLDIPYFIITATLPPYIKEKIPTEKTIRSEGNIGNEKNNPRNPYTVESVTEDLTPSEITDYIDKESVQNVMVVKNTVRGAQKFAFRLDENPNIDVTYYSSEFTYMDRNKKEQEIRSNYTTDTEINTNKSLNVLVSTQVCEISLDISVDKIHTDIAPIDSLLQRMGRLHRKGTETTSNKCECEQCQDKTNSHKYKCTIHFPNKQKETGKIYPYSTDTENKEYNLIYETGKFFQNEKVYSFVESVGWLQKIYRHISTSELNSFEYATAFKKDILYGPPRWDGIEDIDLRKITNRKQDVFPSKYREKDKTPEELWIKNHHRNHKNITDKNSLFVFVGDYHSDEYHTSKCGLKYNNWSECHSELYKFSETYSVPMPRYWIHNDEASITSMEIKIRNMSVTVKATPKVDLTYSYKFGLLPSELENELDTNFI